MPTAFEDVLLQSAAIEEAAKATLGLVKVHSRAPEALAAYPCTVRYIRNITLAHSKGEGKHNILRFVVELHIQRGLPGGLEECERQALPFIERMQNLYAANLSLNGSCSLCTFDDPSAEYGELEWGGLKTFGIRFSFWAKLQGGITVEL